MAVHGVSLTAATETIRDRVKNKNTIFDVLAKIEINSILSSDVTRMSLVQFLDTLPTHSHHFPFIHANIIYYILSHTTMKTIKEKLYEARRLMNVLDIAKSVNVPSSLKNINNKEMVRNVNKFLDRLENIETTKINFNADAFFNILRKSDAGSAVAEKNNIIGKILATIDKIVLRHFILMSCRVTAELIKSLFKNTLRWFYHNTVFYEDFIDQNDGTLDLLLKIYHAFTYFPSTNSHLEQSFVEIIETHLNANQAFDFLSDNPNIAPEQKHLRDLSYMIAAKTLNASNAHLYSFPHIVSDLSVFDHMKYDNFFFHPGVCHHLLTKKTFTSEDNSRIQSINNFLEQIVNTHLKEKPEKTNMHIAEVFHRLYFLNMIGLNPITTEAYVNMLCTYPGNAFEAKFNKVMTNLYIVVINTHVFYKCANKCNPTFIFRLERDAIMDQCKSTLSLNPRVQKIWGDVERNISDMFRTGFSKDTFDALSDGARDEDIYYMYRDMLFKWGELFFDVQVPTLDKKPERFTSENLIDICKTACASASDTAFELLLPFTSYRFFFQIFMTHFFGPKLTQLSNLHFDEYKVNFDIIVTLIVSCRALIPTHHLILAHITALYNLTIEIDPTVGTFKTILFTMNDLAQMVSSSTDKTLPLGTRFLSTLMDSVYTHHIQTSVDHDISVMLENIVDLALSYVQFTKRCSAILSTRCTFSFNPYVIDMHIDDGITQKIPVHVFLEYCKNTIEEHRDNIRNTLTTIVDIKASVSMVMSSLEKDVREVPLPENDKNILTVINDSTHSLKSVFNALNGFLLKCKNSNSILIKAFKRILKTIDVLSNEEIHHNTLNVKILEAAEILKRYNPSDVFKIERKIPEDRLGILEDQFQDAEIPAAHDAIQMTHEQKQNIIHKFPFLDIFDPRYDIEYDPGEFFGWYSAFTIDAQADILQELNFAKETE